MDRATLKKLLKVEINDGEKSNLRKFKGNVVEYYNWMQQIDRAAPNYPLYYIGGEEVPFSAIYSVLDEMMPENRTVNRSHRGYKSGIKVANALRQEQES